jgi:EAL domain-containing protein (putative c-di-GMP-specific phosphodiesterase class I)
MQILDLAQRFGRLYDIEKATLRNTLTYLSNNQEVFEKRKLFINAITSQLLNEEDYSKLRADFGELLEKVVIELTEQTEISDEMLINIHRRLKNDKMELAIDDYGTGYSNTSNLIRYNPDYVKIDRALISHIDSNPKMQKIVSNIIDFLHASGYIALAEGVETAEELKTMIGFGADLIQGYYVSRPKPVLLREISEDVQAEIVRINLEAAEVQKIYRPAVNETVDICRLAVEKYTDIFIDVPVVTLSGVKDQVVSLNVTVKDDTTSEIILNDAVLASTTENPVIRVGSRSSVRLVCQGENRLELKGIFVPRKASLNISGDGSLEVNSESLNCYAIGCDCDHSGGSITVDMTGSLSVSVNGERCIGIGG